MHAVPLSIPAGPRAAGSSRKSIWAGRILSGIALILLAMDAAIKLFLLPVAVESTTKLGFSVGSVFAIGALEAICLVLYVAPRTSLLGAVLWTAYFGGAVATHLRSGDPLLTHTLSPVYMATILWIGLWLRDVRVRAIVRAAFDAR